MTKLVGRCLFTVWGTGMLIAWSCAHPAAPFKSGLVRPVSEADRLKIQRRYGQLPLDFEANQGQTDERVQSLLLSLRLVVESPSKQDEGERNAHDI